MSLSLGIVGLPNVGKSTLFNALLKTSQAQASNYPFTTIEPNTGIVQVPDPRIDALAKIVQPGKLVPATVEFWDIAGIIKGASKGEGLGNQFLANIRQASALILVTRCFNDADVIHVNGVVDPVADLQTVLLELMLADLDTVSRGVERYRRAAKGGDKTATGCLAFSEKLYAALEQGLLASTVVPSSEVDELTVQELQLMTTKPMLVVGNVDENELTRSAAELYEKYNFSRVTSLERFLPLCAKVEAELALLEAEEQKEFLESYGLKESGLDRLAQTAYALLNLRTYFTAGPIEVRAWTIPSGMDAQHAAGVIHTDFIKGFIRAETIGYSDYIAGNGESGAKEAGKLRLEGKEYIVHDGDVMHFRVGN